MKGLINSERTSRTGTGLRKGGVYLVARTDPSLHESLPYINLAHERLYTNLSRILTLGHESPYTNLSRILTLGHESPYTNLSRILLLGTRVGAGRYRVAT